MGGGYSQPNNLTWGERGEGESSSNTPVMGKDVAEENNTAVAMREASTTQERGLDDPKVPKLSPSFLSREYDERTDEWSWSMKYRRFVLDGVLSFLGGDCRLYPGPRHQLPSDASPLVSSALRRCSLAVAGSSELFHSL